MKFYRFEYRGCGTTYNVLAEDLEHAHEYLKKYIYNIAIQTIRREFKYYNHFRGNKDVFTFPYFYQKWKDGPPIVFNTEEDALKHISDEYKDYIRVVVEDKSYNIIESDIGEVFETERYYNDRR